jgi:hypothetical protein
VLAARGSSIPFPHTINYSSLDSTTRHSRLVRRFRLGFRFRLVVRVRVRKVSVKVRYLQLAVEVLLVRC